MDGHANITCLFIVLLSRQQGGEIIISKKRVYYTKNEYIISSMKQNHRNVIKNFDDNTCIV